MKLFVMCGPSGSGKSSFISSNAKEGDIIVSSDAIRIELTGGMQDQSQNDLVFYLFHKRIKEALSKEKNVWADATHLRRKDRLETAKIGFSLGSDVQYIVIDRTLENKLKTAGWRENIILKNGKSLVETHHDIFQQNLNDILSGDDYENITVIDNRIV